MIIPQKTLVVIVIIAFVSYSFFIALPTSPLFAGAGYDREVFKYVGMVIGEDGSPYVDVFDHKPPLIYFIAALGDISGIWGFWLIERIVTGATAFIFYTWLRNRKFKGSFWLALLFITLSIQPLIYEGGGLTRTFTACINLVAFCVIGGSLKNKYWMGGILTGTTLMLQQNEILPVCGWLIVWVFLNVDKAKILTPFLTFIAGSLIAIIPLLIFLLIKGAMLEFINQAILFNFAYIATSQTITDRLYNLLMSSLGLGLCLPFLFVILILVATGLSKIKSYKPDKFLLPCVAALIGQTIAIVLSGRFLPHYFLGLVPILIIALAIALKEVREIKPVLLPVALILFFLVSVSVNPFMATLSKSFEAVSNITRRAEYDHINDDLSQYLTPLTGQKGQLFVFRNTPKLHLNTYFRIISPSKFIYTHLYESVSGWDRNGALFDSILENLRDAKTHYILDYSSTDPIRPDLQTKWVNFINLNYSKAVVLSDFGVLYTLKSN